MAQASTKEIIRPSLVVQPSQLMSSGFRGYSGVDQERATSLLLLSSFSLVAMKAGQVEQLNPQKAVVLLTLHTLRNGVLTDLSALLLL
jgi:hypothetical protein